MKNLILALCLCSFVMAEDQRSLDTEGCGKVSSEYLDGINALEAENSGKEAIKEFELAYVEKLDSLITKSTSLPCKAYMLRMAGAIPLSSLYDDDELGMRFYQKLYDGQDYPLHDRAFAAVQVANSWSSSA